MWLSRSALERIRELELALRDSVPGDVYRASLARTAEVEGRLDEERKEHARQVRWFSSMLLRRAGSMALPPTPEEKAEAVKNEPPPVPSDTAIAQAEAIFAEGKRVDAGHEQILEALRAVPGMTEEAVAAVMSGRVM